MKQIACLFILIVAASDLWSQKTDTTWYNDHWDVTTKAMAVYYRPLPVLTDSGYVVKDYYRSGRLQYIGLSEDAAHAMKLGTATWFKENGEVLGSTTYADYIQDGNITKHYNDGSLLSVVPYKHWKKNGTAKFYYRNSQQASSIQWKDNMMEGESISWYNDGAVRIKAEYHNNYNNGSYQAFFSDGKIKMQRYFVNGVPSGDVVLFKSNGDTLSLLHYNKGLLTGISPIRSNNETMFQLKDGLLHGEYLMEGWHESITAKFANGRMQYWVRNYKGAVVDSAFAVNDSVAYWKHYNYRTGLLLSDGYWKHDQPYGLWNFYDDDELKSTTYKITSPVIPQFNYVDDVTLRIMLPDWFDGMGSDYKLEEDYLQRPLNAGYSWYNKNGSVGATGTITAGKPSGKWLYKKNAAKQLTVNYDTAIANKKEILGFMDITVLHDEPGSYSNHLLLPWEVYLRAVDDSYYINIGDMVKQVAAIDTAFKQDVIARIKQKLGNHLSADLQQSIKDALDPDIRTTIKEMVSDEDERVISNIPVLLRK